MLLNYSFKGLEGLLVFEDNECYRFEMPGCDQMAYPKKDQTFKHALWRFAVWNDDVDHAEFFKHHGEWLKSEED